MYSYDRVWAVSPHINPGRRVNNIAYESRTGS